MVPEFSLLGWPQTLVKAEWCCDQKSDQTQDFSFTIPDNKVHGANMGPIWGQQDPGGPHVDPMNFAIWDAIPMG